MSSAFCRRSDLKSNGLCAFLLSIWLSLYEICANITVSSITYHNNILALKKSLGRSQTRSGDGERSPKLRPTIYSINISDLIVELKCISAYGVTWNQVVIG